MSTTKDRRSHEEWDAIYRTQGFAHKNGYPDSSVVAVTTRAFGREGHDQVKVLDLGCGWGNHLRFLCAEGYDAHGIDGSETAISHCRSITPQVVCGSFLDLPYADATFDAVIDRNSIQCNTLDVVEAVIGEVHRTLKPGGMLYSILLSHTSQPEAFHAYYLESPATRLEHEQVEELFARFSSRVLDQEKRTYNGGDLTVEQWHVIARK